MTYIMIPNAEAYKFDMFYQKHINLMTSDIRLHCPIDIPKIGSIYDWVKDKGGIVEATLDNYRRNNADECSDSDYIKPKPKWYKGDYKIKIRETVIKSIKEIENGTQ